MAPYYYLRHSKILRGKDVSWKITKANKHHLLGTYRITAFFFHVGSMVSSVKRMDQARKPTHTQAPVPAISRTSTEARFDAQIAKPGAQ